MPAINVNPMRLAAWGPRDVTSSGGVNPPCGNCLRQFYGAKAPSPLCGALLVPFSGLKMGGRCHAGH